MASQGVASCMFAVAILFGVFASVPQSDTLSLSIYIYIYIQINNLYLAKLKQSIYSSIFLPCLQNHMSCSHFILYYD
jgi:hypothetical protein